VPWLKATKGSFEVADKESEAFLLRAEVLSPWCDQREQQSPNLKI